MKTTIEAEALEKVTDLLRLIAKTPDLPNPDRDADWKSCQKWSSLNARKAIALLESSTAKDEEIAALESRIDFLQQQIAVLESAATNVPTNADLLEALHEYQRIISKTKLKPVIYLEYEGAIQARLYEKHSEAIIRAQPPSGWLPIESAPRDGTKLLVINGPEGGYGGFSGHSQKPYNIGVAYYDEGRWMASDCCDGVSTYLPTHWQPLPAPPTEDK